MSVDFTIATRMEDGSYWHGECDASFNVSNANAAAILDALGIEWDSCGSVDAREMIGRCAAWRAVGVAQERAATQGVGANGCRWYEGGIDRAYIERRIGQMEALAELARDRGGEVGWS